MIRTEQERARLKARLMSWRRLKRHLVSLFSHWTMDEPGLLKHIAQEIERMENDLQLYECRLLLDPDEKENRIGSAPSPSPTPSHLRLNIESLGADLIKTRLSLGWSQADLANAAQLKQQQISRYELELYARANVCLVQRIAAVLIFEIQQQRQQQKQQRKSAIHGSTPDSTQVASVLNNGARIES